MALLDFLGYGGPGIFGGIAPQFNEQDEAQAARDAAARRLRGGVINSERTPGPELLGPMFGAGMPLPNNLYGAPEYGLLPYPNALPPSPPPQPVVAQQPAAPQRIAPPMSLMPPPQDQAALPPNAAPTQGALPPQMQPQGPGMGDRFGASVQSLVNSPTLLSGLANAFQSMQTGQRTDPIGQGQANQTATAKAIFDGLVANGHSPQQAYGIAVAASTNPEIAKAILPQALGPKEPPKTMEELYARQAYEQQRKGGNQSAAVIPATSAAPGSAPGIAATGAPANYLDWLTTKKAAETLGEKRGANQATLPTAIQNADLTVKHIDELLKHPGFDRLFGITGMFPSIPGGNAAGADARMKQVTGEAFLSGFDMLRGGGAITEIEGKKATDAKARFDRAQSPEEARVALKDFRDAVIQGRAKLQEQAGVAPTVAPGSMNKTSSGVTWSVK